MAQLNGSEIQFQADAGGTMKKCNITYTPLHTIMPASTYHSYGSLYNLILLCFFPKDFFLPLLGIVYNFLWNMCQSCPDLPWEVLSEVGGISLHMSKEPH